MNHLVKIQIIEQYKTIFKIKYVLRDWIPIEKLDWPRLSSNPNAIELLEENQDKINWYWFSLNPSIFTLDYTQMRINFQDLEEEIIKEVMKPRRIFRNLELYGYDIDDMFD